jgi:hypothetical protein
MLTEGHRVTAPVQGDFLVDGRITFEVGGPSKKRRQLKDLEDGWIVKDGLESGSGKVLPMWVFGMLY